MRKKIVAGNWKMNGSTELVNTLLPQLAEVAKTLSAVVLVCPPAPYLSAARDKSDGQILIGAQNCHDQSSGAYTGEISVGMLQDLSVGHVLLGHSERRALFGETDAQVADKVIAATQAGLVAVLCVGETLAEREDERTLSVVLSQVAAVTQVLPVAEWHRLVIAYEPVWAIGTGQTATSEQAQEVHAAIRAFLAEQNADAADAMSILYGGSVKADNASELFAQPDIDGALVGGASLDAKEFISICQQAG